MEKFDDTILMTFVANNHCCRRQVVSKWRNASYLGSSRASSIPHKIYKKATMCKDLKYLQNLRITWYLFGRFVSHTTLFLAGNTFRKHLTIQRFVP